MARYNLLKTKIKEEKEMALTVDRRPGNLLHEIKEIKKELILDKPKKVVATQNRINSWDILGKKISCKYTSVPAHKEALKIWHNVLSGKSMVMSHNAPAMRGA